MPGAVWYIKNMFKNKLFIFRDEELVQNKLNDHLLGLIGLFFRELYSLIQGFHNEITELFLQNVNWYYKYNFVTFLGYKE